MLNNNMGKQTTDKLADIFKENGLRAFDDIHATYAILISLEYYQLSKICIPTYIVDLPIV